MLDAEARLGADDLAERVRRLGFRGDDVPDVLAAARQVLDAGDIGIVQRMADRLLPAIGAFAEPTAGAEPEGADPWADNPGLPGAERSGAYGPGVLAVLALVASADEVVAFHGRRGISAELSWGSLADLGQQVWVHRQTYGGFGLHTQGWLRIAWSGALLWLGRLQFNLQPGTDQPDQPDPGWVLSTHIPQSGPLDPAAVDASFAQARTVFGHHFADLATRDFHCHSWLLDPQLAEVLPAGSNLVRFQQRWQLHSEPTVADDDVIFFVFRERGAVDLDALPQNTTLERAVVRRLRDGGHWHSRHGRLPQAGIQARTQASTQDGSTQT